MGEVSVFDAYRIERLLHDQLQEGDKLESLARDDATGAYWVLTGRELLVVQDDEIGTRFARGQLGGHVESTPVGDVFRLRSAGGDVAIGTFRKPNRLSRTIAAALEQGS